MLRVPSVPGGEMAEFGRDRIVNGVLRLAHMDLFDGHVAAGVGTRQLGCGAFRASKYLKSTARGFRIRRSAISAYDAPLPRSENGHVTDAYFVGDLLATMALNFMLQELDPQASIGRLAKPDLLHGTDVVKVDESTLRAYPENLSVGFGDGIITNVRHLPLMVNSADCAPVFMVDPVHDAIGVFHSGHRGVLKGISEAGLKAMREAYGTRPEEVHAMIGPYADGDKYEFGADLEQVFRSQLIGDEPRYSADQMERMFVPHHSKPDKFFFDHGLAISYDLERLGVQPGRMSRCSMGTMGEDQTFASARRDGEEKRGTNVAMIVLT